MDKIHSLTTLRRKIRQAGHQFRQKSDTSKSLFSPTNGFVYAYQIHLVEQALDEYENTIPVAERPEPEPVQAELSMEQQIINMASTIINHHDSMEARDFARTVMAYLALNQPQQKNNPLALLRGKGYSKDVIED